jgi:ketosteroid isomerase-like protein
MTEQDTRSVVRDLYQAYANRNAERVAALIHDDIDWVIYGPVQIFPFQGPRHGKSAVLEVLGAIANDYAIESYTPEIVIVEGNRAALMSDASFVQRTTNRTLRFRIADFLRVQDGRVIEFREFFNSFDAVEQALGRWLDVGPG